MATISQIITSIRTAVYGRDVRSSIAEGINMCYSDITSGKTLAENAATNANSKAALANTAATAANSAATNANSKATLADNAATSANNAATTANTAASNANIKATLADNAASKINNMTVAASMLQPGSAPTATISEVSGHKHIAFAIPKGDRGKDFRIVKTFTSISQMNSYSGSDIEDYDFVMIDSGNPNDEDSGKLYFYESSSNPIWRYIGNISGAQGIKGDTGTGIESITLNNDYTLTINYTDNTSVTTDPIRGEKGDTGAVPNITIGTVTTIPANQNATITRRAGSPDNAPIFDFLIPRGDVNTNFVKSAFSIAVNDWESSTSNGVTTYTKAVTVYDVDQDSVYWVSYSTTANNIVTSISTDTVTFSTTTQPTATIAGDIIVAKSFDMTVVNAAEGVDF